MAQSTSLFVGLDVHKDSIAVAHVVTESQVAGSIKIKTGVSRR
jgi:hypothetical protein